MLLLGFTYEEHSKARPTQKTYFTTRVVSSVVTVSKILLSVGFGRFCKKTAVFGSVLVFVCPVFFLSSMWYVYAAHCTSNLQQYVTYFCV